MSNVLAEFQGLSSSPAAIEVGEHPPTEIRLEPRLQARWGDSGREARVMRLQRIEAPAGGDPRAIYGPA